MKKRNVFVLGLLFMAIILGFSACATLQSAFAAPAEPVYVYRATLWINGVPQILSETDSTANSVFVYGSDVFVVGSENGRATLWTNGVPQTLGNYQTTLHSVFASGGNVYVAGITRAPAAPLGRGMRATLWVNGVPQTLSNTFSRAFSVFVYGSDVYVMGDVDGQGWNTNVTLWVNGVPQTLGNTGSPLGSVFVHGNNVYVAGSNDTGQYQVFHYRGHRERLWVSYEKAALWVNGTLQTLNDPESLNRRAFVVREFSLFIPSSSARSVFVYGDDVFVVGEIRK